jgi:hypothetical protein
MTALIQSLKARFAGIRNVEIDEDHPVVGSVASFHVESTVAECYVGVFASEGSPGRVTIAMEVADVARAGMLAKLTRTTATVRVNAHLQVETRRITSMDETKVLYYEMDGDRIPMQKVLDCVALITRLFQGVAEHEARQALADMRV